MKQTSQEITRLPDAELEVMQALWHHETPISTSQLHALLGENRQLRERRQWNISTLQTLLKRLLARGFVQMEKQGKSYWYSPLVDEETYFEVEDRLFFERMRSRSLTRLVASLYSNKQISEQDLEELGEFIEDTAKDHSDEQNRNS